MAFLRLARATEDEQPDGPMVFVASTPGTKRDGLDLTGLPWSVDNYRNAPIVTWSHDFAGNRLPIGRAEVEIVGGQRADRAHGETLRAAITFDRADPFAAEVERKYRDGFLHAVSVSWDDVDANGVPTSRAGGKAVAHELLEIAAVPVPGDPAALIERQAVALRSLVRELDAVMSGADVDDAVTVEETIDVDVTLDVDADALPAEGSEVSIQFDTGDGQTLDIVGMVTAVSDASDDDAFPETPERAWAAMVRAFDRQDGASDDVRRKRYNRAEAAYRKLGMVAPEWLGGDELRALDDAAWRGLWLEGEIVAARAGAVLSRRNLARLDAAIDALMEIRREASGEDGEDVKPKPGDDTRAAIGEAIDGLTVDDLQRLAAALFGGK